MITIGLAAMMTFATSAAGQDLIALPGDPFGVIPSQDGHWLFISLVDSPRESGRIAVLKRDSSRTRVARTVLLPGAPTGMTLTNDGKLLVAAAGNHVVFLDVTALTTGRGEPIVGDMVKPGEIRGAIYANVSPDDNWLFVSEESAARISVIDMNRARHSGYRADAIVGGIPAGRAPIALTFSPDGKWLYTTSELAPPEWRWPAECTQEGSDRPEVVNPAGAVIVVDVEKAHIKPAEAVVARVRAGCSPVRAAISTGGDRLFITERHSNALAVFDTAKLVADGTHALIALVPVGDSPVPVAVADNGRKVLVGNSNRFARAIRSGTITVVDASRLQQGPGAVIGTIPAGKFPREMRLSADAGTIFLTNFASASLQLIDVNTLPH